MGPLSRWPALALILAVTLGGCGAAPESAPKAGIAPEVSAPQTVLPGDLYAGLPASFSGAAPCADCPGDRHLLELYPDQTYVYRLTRFDAGVNGDAANFDDIGRWVLENGVIRLRGGREAPVFFAVQYAVKDAAKDAVTLHRLDFEGNPVESASVLSLSRAVRFEPIEPVLFMRGMYRYLADAALFEECLTGWRLAVSMTADNVALERAYLASGAPAGQPVLVNLEASIRLLPGMEGDAQVRSLVPVRFINIWPGATCEQAPAG